MKKPFISALTITAMLLTPYLRAQDSAPTTGSTQESSGASASTDIAEPKFKNGPDASTANPASPTTDEPSLQAPLATDLEMEDDGTPVGQASTEGTKTAKKKMWQNITLAVVSVAIAVTALILVSKNDGHSKHHHK